MSAHNHVLPISVYIKNFLALLVLMALTVWAAMLPTQFPYLQEHSVINNLTAMGIAVTKAVLVIMFFMHAKFSTKLSKLFVVLGFAWLSLMFGFFIDYSTRHWEEVPGWTTNPPNIFDPTAEKK
jgi:cytochrome c oxidase subunit 4